MPDLTKVTNFLSVISLKTKEETKFDKVNSML